MKSRHGLEGKLSGCGDCLGTAGEGVSPSLGWTGLCLVGLMLWWGPERAQVSFGLGEGYLGWECGGGGRCPGKQLGLGA